MRKIKYSFPYQRYITNMWSDKLSVHNQIRWDRSVPLPGNIDHNHPRQKVVCNNRLFLNYVNTWDQHKEQVLWRLYWRLHPDEYQNQK